MTGGDGASMTKISKKLSDRLFEITSDEELQDWIRAVDKEVGGISWVPLGGIENNVHTVEVASDPALALVERPTNGIDAELDLKARVRGESAATPHEAARKWWGIPPEGLSALDEKARRELADLVRVTMLESGTADRPTVLIQDAGTGQHPDDFPRTHLSLLGSNKKSATHMMGVYNAGGAASYKFSKGAIIVSRLSPELLNGRQDEVGVAIVKYDPLDPEKFKSGMYVYSVAKNKSILRLDVPGLPDLGHGSYVKLIEYLLPRYARGAYEAKQSLWHLFHAALPDPALPLRIIETRADRFPGMKGAVERRVVSGLLHLMRRPGTADYSDIRPINLGPAVGTITLRYFVLNEGTDPDAYTTSDQGLTITLNGQRQITKDRLWLRRNLELYYLYKRLVVLVDGTGLTNAAKRDVFASTRETGVDSPLAKTILDRVLQELDGDENLDALDEQAKQRTLDAATKTTTDRVKRQLASQIAAYLKGALPGKKGGKRKTKRRKKKGGKPRNIDDSMMLEVPDTLRIVTDPLIVEQGTTAALWLEINAKNDFLPRYAEGLSIVIGPELKDHVKAISKGRLLGGRVRVTVEAAEEAPVASSSLKVALVVPSLGVLLTADGHIEVLAPKEDEEEKDSKKGGEPNIEVQWVGRDKWDTFEPVWNADMVGDCLIYRDDPNNKTAITKVEWVLNEAFASYEKVVEEKKLGEAALKTFREGYEYPVLFGLFKQRLAEEAKEREADEEGRNFDIPDDYVRGERARLARAVLMAMEPEIHLAAVAE
jgi:hypothetical protein